MTKIGHLLNNRGKRKLLVPFFTVGYPTRAQSLDLVYEAVDTGADIIELGVPFSDPLADGSSVQYSSQVALKNNISLMSILADVSKLRRKINLPLVLMGYYNPILAFGLKRFCMECSNAGVDGLIIPDLPVEESGELRQAVGKASLSSIFLVAPTSSKERIKLIDRSSTDFVYAVTVAGVTGARSKFSAETESYLKKLKKDLIKPFVAGFGVSTPETARLMTRYSDGVVIGSALIERIRNDNSFAGGRKAV